MTPFHMKWRKSMITAKKGGKRLTRNSSAFKKIQANPQLVPIEEPVEVDEEEEEVQNDQEVTPAVEPPQAQLPADLVPSAPVPAPAPAPAYRTTRSGRVSKPGSQYQDYVLYK
jgi:hypothetical protein